MDHLTIAKDIVALFCAIFGGAFALFQYYKTVKLKAASHLNDIVTAMRDDKEIRDFIQLIEYGNFTFDTHFQGSPCEHQADKTLEYLSYICYLKEQHLIGEKEFAFVKYEIDHLLTNEEVVRYLKFLYHFSCNVIKEKPGPNPIADVTFKQLLEYAYRNHLINESFFTS